MNIPYARLWAAIKGPNPAKGVLGWIALYLVGNGIMAAVHLMSSLSAGVSPFSGDISGMQTADSSSSPSYVTYGWVLIAFIVLGWVNRTPWFASAQQKVTNPTLNAALNVVNNVINTIAKHRFYLAALCWVFIAFDWSTFLALIIFAVTVGTLYLHDRRPASTKTATKTNVIAGLSKKRKALLAIEALLFWGFLAITCGNPTIGFRQGLEVMSFYALTGTAILATSFALIFRTAWLASNTNADLFNIAEWVTKWRVPLVIVLWGVVLWLGGVGALLFFAATGALYWFFNLRSSKA